MISSVRSLGVPALCAIAFSCVCTAQVENLRPPASPQPATVAPATASAAGVIPADTDPYVIGPLDVLDIRVWNEPKLGGIFAVSPNGFVPILGVGDVKAAGFTRGQFQEVLRQKFSAWIVDPQVNIQVSKINSKKYFIYGGVGHPGEFSLIAPITVMDAFANCGGFTQFANKKKIRIVRGNQEFRFNFDDAMKGKNPGQNILLQSGDRIYVKD